MGDAGISDRDSGDRRPARPPSNIALSRLAPSRAWLTSPRVLELPWPVRYAMAPAATLLVFGIQRWLLPDPTIAPFVFFFFGAALVAWFGGRIPGLLTVALSALAGNYFFFAPVGAWTLTRPAFTALALFLVAAGLEALLASACRDAALALRREVHERARVEMALREAQSVLGERNRELDAERARWRGVIEAIADEVWSCDALGHLTPLNPKSRESTELARYEGKTVQEVLERAGVELLRPDGTLRPSEESPMLVALHRGEVVRGELLMRDRDTGAMRAQQYSSAPIRDASGAITGAVSVVRDITEHRAVEVAARENEARYRQLFENMLNGMAYCRMLFDDQGRPHDFIFLEVNAAFGPNSGLHDVVGKKVSEIVPGIQASNPEMIETYGRVAATGEPARIEFYVPPLASWFSVGIYSPKRDYFVSVFENITQRKTSEEALAATNEKLREEQRRRDAFLATLSHELRNPLAPIVSCLDVLDRLRPDEVERARHGRETIRRQVDQLSHLVDDLLEVNRVTHDKIRLRREQLDLRTLVRSTVDDHASLFSKKGVRLELALPEEAVPVHVDGARVHQIVGNLLQNAAKFTAEGCVCVGVTVDRTERVAILRVVDTGAGMSEELLAHLFEPFVQADRTLDRTEGGLGLGLALVRSLVQLHGGSVDAGSGGPGMGATFTVRLPLDDVAMKRLASEAAPVADSRRLRVLVIEDHLDTAESVAEVVAMLGHEATIATDGAEGLAMLRAMVPDVVLCDIGLPLVDGYEIARRTRADEHLGQVRLVAVSGYSMSSDVARARAAGFDVHMAKPSSFEALERVLGQAAPAKTAPAVMLD